MNGTPTVAFLFRDQANGPVGWLNRQEKTTQENNVIGRRADENLGKYQFSYLRDSTKCE
jgi:hypothetical protein